MEKGRGFTLSMCRSMCLQNDIHAPKATVRESLLFSARLRFGPEVSNETVAAFVDEVHSSVDAFQLPFCFLL